MPTLPFPKSNAVCRSASPTCYHVSTWAPSSSSLASLWQWHVLRPSEPSNSLATASTPHSTATIILSQESSAYSRVLLTMYHSWQDVWECIQWRQQETWLLTESS